MNFLVRFLLPLAVILSGLAYGLVPLVDHLTTRWFVRDLDIRSRLIVNAIKDDLVPVLKIDSEETRKRALSILKKTTQDERLLALAICTPTEKLIVKTELFPDTVTCKEVRGFDPYRGALKSLSSGDVHVSFGYIEDLVEGDAFNGEKSDRGNILGRLIMLHDMSFASKRSNDSKSYMFGVFLGIGLLIALITVFVARWSMATWVKSVRELVIGVRSRRIDPRSGTVDREFMPILKDLKGLVRDLEASAREKDDAQVTWDPVTLRQVLVQELAGDEVIVVSNRQPYIHNRRGAEIDVQCPASGLVTALEPILKACSGVWIAHGNGTADRDVVDHRSRVRVPPGREQYEIHRVWFSKEEEQGYYYGFSNEGLWPLCHIAHTRPVFRRNDWDHYVKVNARFTEAVLADAKIEDPVVLVQDYHLALVPRMLRAKLPKATILSFWHIPWPNPESFGICPWREEILEGLLGSSIVGFHTQFHCNNFIESVDRYLESRIDRETNGISYKGGVSEVRPYPISIEWPPDRLSEVPSVEECRKLVAVENNLSATTKIGIGIDRLDYTKGIIERFRAVERLLELKPKWCGLFSFIQIAAPSRSSITAYQEFDTEVRTIAQQINDRFGSKTYQPIILKVMHHDPKDVFKHFRAADICFVSSLHDGMNLVAKEFVACRDDNQGVLILSMFAGASRELAEALIVNPYDADQSAMALDLALDMSLGEQRERMRALRAIVKEFNVYRWAGRMLLDAARVRRRNRFTKKMRRWGADNLEVIEKVDPLAKHAGAQMLGISDIGVYKI